MAGSDKGKPSSKTDWYNSLGLADTLWAVQRRIFSFNEGAMMERIAREMEKNGAIRAELTSEVVIEDRPVA